MGERMVHFSDLTGQMADEAAGGLIPLIVTDYPDAAPDQRVRIEVTPEELEKIGKLSIAAVGLETEPSDEEDRSRFVVPLAKFATLVTVAPLDEVLANAEPVEPSKRQGRSERRSHNQRADGGPLINYNDPDNAGLPHKGKVGEAEAAFVRDNLDLVNERRVAAGHAPIDPGDPENAKRYGFGS